MLIHNIRKHEDEQTKGGDVINEYRFPVCLLPEKQEADCLKYRTFRPPTHPPTVRGEIKEKATVSLWKN